MAGFFESNGAVGVDDEHHIKNGYQGQQEPAWQILPAPFGIINFYRERIERWDGMELGPENQMAELKT